MSEPSELSIKGTAFLLARRDVLALVDAGRLSRVALERRLEPQDLALLDETPLPTSWYPLADLRPPAARADGHRGRRRRRATWCSAPARAWRR